jgi:hypothetical protein
LCGALVLACLSLMLSACIVILSARAGNFVALLNSPSAPQALRPPAHLVSPGLEAQACHQSLPVAQEPGTPRARRRGLPHPCFRSDLPQCQATCWGAKGRQLMSECPCQLRVNWSECLLQSSCSTWPELIVCMAPEHMQFDVLEKPRPSCGVAAMCGNQAYTHACRSCLCTSTPLPVGVCVAHHHVAIAGRKTVGSIHGRRHGRCARR